MSRAFSASVALPLFCLVIGAQLVFLTVPDVTREGRLSRIPEGEEQCVWEGGCGRKSRGKPPAVVRGPIKCERGGMLHPRRKLGALLNPIRGREDIVILGVYVPGGFLCAGHYSAWLYMNSLILSSQ